MARLHVAALVSLSSLMVPVLAAGCGARSNLQETDPDTPRVDDCERWTPEAVPLGRLHAGSDPWHFSSDDDYLYFLSEERLWRVAKASGAPEALTPPGFPGTGLLAAEGSLFWRNKDGSIYRAPLAGGDPEVIGTAPGMWTIAAGALVTAGLPNKPAPVVRTPLDGGPVTEILPADPPGFVHGLTAVDGGVLVQRSSDVVLVPVNGAPVTVAKVSAAGGSAPVTDGGLVYFSARLGPAPKPTLVRAAPGEASAPAVVLEGWSDAFAIAGDTVYARIVLPDAPTHASSPDLPDAPPGTLIRQGNLVRAPKAGGTPTVMTTTDSFSAASADAPEGAVGVFGAATSGLAVDEAHVYFVELCTDRKGPEYRLVSLPADYTASP